MSASTDLSLHCFISLYRMSKKAERFYSTEINKLKKILQTKQAVVSAES